MLDQMSLLKNCYSRVSRTDLSLEASRSILDSVQGRNLTWEFCCLLKAPELRCVLPCPLQRPLIELHHDQQWGPCVCIIQEAVHCPASSGTTSPGIRWVIEFRKFSCYIQLASPYST